MAFHAVLISFFTHLSLVFQTVNFLCRQCHIFFKAWVGALKRDNFMKIFLFLVTPTHLITWLWLVLTGLQLVFRCFNNVRIFFQYLVPPRASFGLTVGSLDNVITFHLTFPHWWCSRDSYSRVISGHSMIQSPSVLLQSLARRLRDYFGSFEILNSAWTFWLNFENYSFWNERIVY